MKKALVVRFSSFGDIIQSFEGVEYLVGLGFEVTFLTKSSFSSLAHANPSISRVVSLEKKDGLQGLIKLSLVLSKGEFDLLYDAHSNIRTRVIKTLFFLFSRKTKIVVRSKERLKRFAYFFLGFKTFSFPIKGRLTYLAPFKTEKLSSSIKLDFSSLNVSLPIENFIAIAPSAAWPMKRWPVSHFKELIKRIDGSMPIILLGGPDDHFIAELVLNDSVYNLAGKLSLLESAFVVNKAKLLITADTGLLHVADILNVSTIALLGPTAFGYPSSESSLVIEKKLSCDPCSKDGRGRCKRAIYQQCMAEISVEEVLKAQAYLLK